MDSSLSKLKILENLSSDQLEDDFVKCFWPMHIIQMCLGSSRVDLINRYATQPTGCQKIYTVFWIAATIGSTLYLVNHFYVTYYDDNIVLYYIVATAGYMQCVPSVLNLVHVRFFNGSKNVELYVTMQKIDRAIGLEYIKILNWHLFKLNLCYAFLLIFVYLTVIVIVIYIKMKNPMFTIFLGFSIVSKAMETALQEHLTYFLVTRLQCVNETLKAHLVRNRRCQCSDDTENANLHNILCNGEDYLIAPKINECFTCSMPRDNVVKSLKFALKAFKIINKTFRFQVILMMSSICVWILLVINALVIGQSIKFVPQKGAASLSMWVLLDFIHVTAQSVFVELFLSRVNITKHLCIRILSLCYEGSLRQTAKRLLITLEAATPHFSVYNMFTLDKRLPLKLIGLISTYVLLLMQFTLL